MNPKPQKWRRPYGHQVLTIETESGGIWEVTGDRPRAPSGPGRPLEWMQHQADKFADGPASGPWQRICRVCDAPMQLHKTKGLRQDHVAAWLCLNLHKEEQD
jgi:hypothetical protein